MLVKCPKCGFEQPQDRFCANCGIDIGAYKPKVSFGSRLAANSLFYVFLIAIVISATVILLHSQMQPQLPFVTDATETVTESTGVASPEGSPIAGLTPATVAENPSPPSGPPTQTLTASAASPSHAPSAPAAMAMAADTSAPPPHAASAARVAQPVRPSLRIVLIEAQQDFLRDIAAERTDRGEGDHGVVTSLRKLLADGRRNATVKILEETPHDLPPKDQPLIIFRGTRDPKLKEPVGLFFQILPSVTEERMMSLRIEAKRVLPAPAPAGGEAPVSDIQTITREFIVPPGGAAYFTSLFPHRRKPLEHETELYTSTPFMAVLLSERFQEGLTEFVAFFELSTQSSSRETSP